MLLRSLRPRMAAVATSLASIASVLAASAACAQPWNVRLEGYLQAIDPKPPLQLGVHVRDLDTGTEVNHHAEETWYLASMVKTPIAIAVLRAVERGDFTLDTTLRLRASDYVDGAGETNSRPVAAPVTIRFLIDQMIIQSDNTASDMLIDLVGLRAVNEVVQSLTRQLDPPGIQPITTLADVRREVYGRVTPAAERLSGKDWLHLKQQPTDKARLELLSQLTRVPPQKFKLRSLDAAYASYYASGLNSGRLDVYGEMLQALFDGRALSPQYTRYLTGVMSRTATGTQRIKAALPPHVGFAHKTGTQRARFCDSGLLQVADPPSGSVRRIVIVACTRGDASLARSERALREVGHAVCRSGLLTQGVVDAPSCHVAAGGAVTGVRSSPVPR
ncbi:serine hydrolase [Variovorax sp. VNK109]|uniref:serine hydrolase n=1 Tax=Variovorax sp. VNK109 TaxID=3400919 RepID=UPI003C07EDBB